MKIIRTSECLGQDPMHIARLIGARNDEIVVVVHDDAAHGTQPDSTHANDTQPDSTLAYDPQTEGTLAYDLEDALDAFARATFALDDDGAPPPAGEP